MADLENDIEYMRAKIEEIKTDEQKFLDTTSKEDILKILKQINPSGTLKLEKSEKYTILGITHISRWVMINEVMLGAMGYIFQSAKEYLVDVSEAEEDAIKEANPDLNDFEITKKIKEKQKEKTAEAKPYIDGFLSRFFKFNPNKHVERLGEFKIEDVEIPVDPYFAFDHYMATHHTELTSIVVDKILKIPNFMSDLVYVAASGLDEKEATIKFNALKQTTKSPLYKVKEGHMVLIGDDKRIRENIDMKGDDLLSRVLNRQAEERQLSADILKKTVKIAKIENIKRTGLDDPEFLERVRELHPEREITEVLTKAELEELNAKFHAEKLKKQQKQISDDAPFGTKVIPFYEINPQATEPEKQIEEKVYYSEIDHYVELA